jgi:hypothetical protein
MLTRVGVTLAAPRPQREGNKNLPMAERPPDDDRLALNVLKTSAESRLRPGHSFALRAGATIGRSAPADIQLDDATVSRTHVRVERGPDGLLLHNVSENNGLFIDRIPVEPGEAGTLPWLGGRVQIGGVLLEAAHVEATRPVAEPMSLSGAVAPRATEEPFFVITMDGDACAVRCAGRHFDVWPHAAKALLALCRTPARVVHEWDIQDQVGQRCNVAQLMSSVRRGLLSLVEEGAISEGQIRSFIALTASGEPVRAARELSGAALMRRFVIARRGHGYAILLPESAIAIEEEG